MHKIRLGLFQLVVLGSALLIVSGCDSALTSTSIPHLTPSAIPADDPTAGAVVRSTRQAQATVTAQAQRHEEATQVAKRATQTAEEHAQATATAAAQATQQAIVTEKNAWPLRITEVFTSNLLGWPVGLKQDHSLAVTSTLQDGRYQWVVKVADGNSYFNLVPTNTPIITNFVAAVNVMFGPRSADDQVFYGLTFRHVKDDYGFFGITPSGMWQALEVHHTGIYQKFLSSSDLIDMRPGEVNRLEVIGRGSDFVFLINGQPVGMLSAEIAPGRIGLGVDALQSADTAQVEFSQFEVQAP